MSRNDTTPRATPRATRNSARALCDVSDAQCELAIAERALRGALTIGGPRTIELDARLRVALDAVLDARALLPEHP